MATAFPAAAPTPPPARTTATTPQARAPAAPRRADNRAAPPAGAASSRWGSRPEAGYVELEFERHRTGLRRRSGYRRRGTALHLQIVGDQQRPRRLDGVKQAPERSDIAAAAQPDTDLDRTGKRLRAQYLEPLDL